MKREAGRPKATWPEARLRRAAGVRAGEDGLGWARLLRASVNPT